MPEDVDDRLTILERAQLLHDATLRRHGEMLDEHATAMAEMRGLQDRQHRLMETLTGIAHRLAQRQDDHAEQMAALRQILQAIKDMLERGNGH